MTTTNAAQTETLLDGYFEFSQDYKLVVRLKNQPMPLLSDKALELLEYARDHADSVKGWEILPYEAKVSLMESALTMVKMRAEEDEGENPSEDRMNYLNWARDMEPYVWEAILFLKRYVKDVSPFRDNQPSP